MAKKCKCEDQPSITEAQRGLVRQLQRRLAEESQRLDGGAAQDVRNWSVALGVALDKLQALERPLRPLGGVTYSNTATSTTQ